MIQLRATRLDATLRADPARVLARPFVPGEWGTVAATSRASAVIDRVLAIPHGQVETVLAQVCDRFADRHRDLDRVLRRHGRMIQTAHAGLTELTDGHLRLLGAYFTQEYAIEGAALTNPSIVPAPAPAADDRVVAPGTLPFVLSARAIGEGHVSSIVFRTGVLDADGGIVIDPAGDYVVGAEPGAPDYDKANFSRQLVTAGADPDVVASVMSHLPARFSMEQLESWLAAFSADQTVDEPTHEMIRLAHWFASTNYIAAFPEDSGVGERVLFPAGPTESRGMEDARFVRFTDDDGAVTYYATYTAYDGFTVRPQLIETADFAAFRMFTLDGVPDQSKGMALFPRRVDGRYAAMVRPDRESIAVATTDDLRAWSDEATTVWRPGSVAWDLIQLGNCGSPIDTDAGWLVLTHGVGPMRRYVLGALLLDGDDPTRPLGYLREAILEPLDDERDGYVPNVVYSCGGLAHAGRLVVPFGFSDVGAAIATVPLAPLLDRLTTAGAV